MTEQLVERQPSTRRLVSVRDAATALAVSAWQVRQLIRQEVLPAVYVGRALRTTWDAVDALIESGGTR